MRLNLKNPIIFFDIESTGLNVATDRIVEISMVKVMPDGSTEVKTRRINPTIHISEESTRIHGIHDEDVKDCPTFNQIAKSLAKWMEGCDIAGYNSNKFDIPVLYEEFLRAGVDFDFRKRKLVDVQNIFHKMEQRTLSAAYKFYCHKDLNNAHSAEADTMATHCRTTSPSCPTSRPRPSSPTMPDASSTTTRTYRCSTSASTRGNLWRKS